MAESAGSLLEQTPPTLPSRAPDVTLETHLAMASRLGLDYGPAFQAIPRAWREGDTMLGEIVPTGAEGEPLHLSPGILDSAFQLFLPLLADSEAAAAGYAFVPIRIDRLQFRADAGRPALAKARLRRTGRLTRSPPTSACSTPKAAASPIWTPRDSAWYGLKMLATAPSAWSAMY